MALQGFLTSSVQLYQGSLLESLDGLDDEELTYRPNQASMSIGFITWHTARIHDMLIHTAALGETQLWISEGWAQRFGRAPGNVSDVGFGFGSADLAEFTLPERDVLFGYLEVSHGAALEHLATQTDESLLSTWVASPIGGSMILADIYQQLIWEMNQHGGQIAFLRGMQRGIEDPFKLSPIWLEAQART